MITAVFFYLLPEAEVFFFLLRKQVFRIQVCPVVFLHVFSAVCVDGSRIILKKPVKITDNQFGLYPQITAFDFQNFLNARFFKCFAQGSDNYIQIFLFGVVMSKSIFPFLTNN